MSGSSTFCSSADNNTTSQDVRERERERERVGVRARAWVSAIVLSLLSSQIKNSCSPHNFNYSARHFPPIFLSKFAQLPKISNCLCLFYDFFAPQ